MMTGQRLKKSLTGLLMAGAVMVPALLPVPAQAGEYDRVENVLLGEAVFQYQTGHSYTAMALLQHGGSRGVFGREEFLAKLFLADLLKEQHSYPQALALYQQVGRKGEARSVRDSAWLKAAKLAYEQGLHDVAREALRQSSGSWNDEQETEAEALQTVLLLLAGESEKAVESLEDPETDSIWALYQHYNAGVRLLDEFGNKRGAAHLHKITALKRVEDPEMLAIMDQSSLSLGYSLLQLEKPLKARKYFEKIRLNSPVSNMALLGMGWSFASEENYKRALVYWLELSQRSYADTYLHESLLAIPYAYARLNAYKQAVNYYEAAIKRFKHTSDAIDKAHNSGYVARLIAYMSTAPEAETAWLSTPSGQVSAEEQALLGLLLESQEFQSALAGYRYLLGQVREAARQKSQINRLKQKAKIAHMEADIASLDMMHESLRQVLSNQVKESQTKLAALVDEILQRHKNQLLQYGQQARFGLAQVIESASLLGQRGTP